MDISHSEKLLKQHKNKVLVIFKPFKRSITLTRTKFIVPRHYSIAKIHMILLQYVNCNEKQGILLFINDILPMQTESIGYLYDSFKSSDGFLYIHVTKENTFG